LRLDRADVQEQRDPLPAPAQGTLRTYLAQGLVVPEERVDAALSSYFRFANLADEWLIRYSGPHARPVPVSS
jgi:hypothetical protein